MTSSPNAPIVSNASSAVEQPPLLTAREVRRDFDQRSNWFGARRRVQALRGVSLSLSSGDRVGLIGESGSGKSTLVRLLLDLDTPTSGTINFLGTPYSESDAKRRREFRQRVQLVFQDPLSSLNPRRRVRDAIEAPLETLTDLDQHARRERVEELLDLVRLPTTLLERFPRELSGGQAQRVAIARALAPKPDLLVLDEAVSSLDVCVQAEILRLLSTLAEQLGLGYLFVAHDLAVVEATCDEVLVMYLGRIVESGPAGEVLHRPAHPYTKALLDAMPSLERIQKRVPLLGEPPSPVNPPTGCAFHPRCSLAKERCANELPTLNDGDARHPCACYYTLESS